MSNLALFTFNRFITRADYAMISAESIERNLGAEWVWDQDEFAVNHIGHPYQGSLYYAAGRSNGLGFIPSAALTAGNSALWELFFETETPSKNDIIATTLGGIALGEMFHRVSMELLPVNAPIAFAFSPMDGFTLMVNRSGSAASREAAAGKTMAGSDTGGNSLSGFTGGRASVGAGVVTTAFQTSNGLTGEKLQRSLTANVTADLQYGELFGLPTAEPYSQFEASLQASFAPSWYALTFLSDGALLALDPLPRMKGDHTAALSLHYDLVYSDPVNFSANSLGVSWKSRYRLPKGGAAWFQLHANWVVLGASDYLYLREGPGAVNTTGGERRDYDFGTGEGVKMAAGISFPAGITVEAAYSGYGMHTIPASVPDGGSEGYTMIGTGSLSVERELRFGSSGSGSGVLGGGHGGGLSSGIMLGFWHRQGLYTNAPDVNDRIALASVYFKHSF